MRRRFEKNDGNFLPKAGIQRNNEDAIHVINHRIDDCNYITCIALITELITHEVFFTMLYQF